MTNDGAIRPLVADRHIALCRESHAEAAQAAYRAIERAVTRIEPDAEKRRRTMRNARQRRWYAGRYVSIEEEG